MADGYGYSDDTLYIHFNMGWNNLYSSNAWYAPPEFDVDEDTQYDIIDEVICNIFTDTGSELGSIASGRVLDASGLDLESTYDRVPLFKVGSAEMLSSVPVDFVAWTRPTGWAIVKTADGLGYDLFRSGFSIIVR